LQVESQKPVPVLDYSPARPRRFDRLMTAVLTVFIGFAGATVGGMVGSTFRTNWYAAVGFVEVRDGEVESIEKAQAAAVTRIQNVTANSGIAVRSLVDSRLISIAATGKDGKAIQMAVNSALDTVVTPGSGLKIVGRPAITLAGQTRLPALIGSIFGTFAAITLLLLYLRFRRSPLH
jgi:hypothetical protein